MKTRFTLERTTGALTRSIDGKDLAAELVSLFTVRDILDCELVIKSGGTDITAATLPTGWALHVGLRYRTSLGAILAQSEEHTMVGSVANFVLSLNTSEIASLVESNLVPESAKSVTAYLEIEVANSYVDASVTKRETLYQAPSKLQFEVNEEGDEPPPTAAASAATATAEADRAHDERLLAEAAAAAAGAAGAAAGVVSPPASSTSAGEAGQTAYDANYFYRCVATNTWRRIPLSDWS